MKITINYAEIVDYIESHYKVRPNISYVDTKTINVSYKASIFLPGISINVHIESVTEETIILSYDCSQGTKLLIKGILAFLKEQLKEVERRIQAACDRAGRKREEVTLIAVSKTKPVSMIEETYQLGIHVYGENKVQELTEKYEILPKDIEWHMIGHLQTNKVKYIVGKTALIHSVDSLKLAETIEKEAAKKNCIQDILVEVNVAQEESKFGLKVDEVIPFIEKISQFQHICVKGLMTIAPFVENPEDNRPVFANLHKLSVDIMNKNIDNVNVSILSMGMTNDYEVAIEEGATMVRVGTGIFGARNYQI